MRQYLAVMLGGILCVGCSNPAASRPEWRRLTRSPQDLGLAAETTSFLSRDSLRLRAWWLPAAPSPAARATIVLAHGSGTNRSGMLSRAAFLVRDGFNVVALDLRAHGESEGRYMSPGWLEADDIRAAVAWARSRDSVPVAVLGHSYGAVAALHVGADSTIAAVIADAPFRNYETMIRNAIAAAQKDPRISRGQRWGLRMMTLPGMGKLAMRRMRSGGVNVPADSAPAAFAVTRLRAPTLFIAGERDDIAPAADVKLLHDASTARIRIYRELALATHGTFADAPDQYKREVLAFLDEVLGRHGRP